MQPGIPADWKDEGFAADGSSTGFFSVSGFADEYPGDGRGFEPSMLVRHSPCDSLVLCPAHTARCSSEAQVNLQWSILGNLAQGTQLMLI